MFILSIIGTYKNNIDLIFSFKLKLEINHTILFTNKSIV